MACTRKGHFDTVTLTPPLALIEVMQCVMLVVLVLRWAVR